MGLLNDEIDKTAAEWAAKVAAGDLTSEEQKCFETWSAADTRHLGAFARAQAVLVRLGRLRAVGADALRASVREMTQTVSAGEECSLRADLFGAGVPVEQSAAPVVPSEAAAKPTKMRRRAVFGGAAGLLAAAGFAGVVMWTSQPQEDFVTGLGETRVIKLPDGSVVTLNTETRISVAYTKAVRKVSLVRGEAIFQVAKNKVRPFIVTAHDTEVRAVGTAFTVRLLPARPVQILVQEGVVEVVRRDKPVVKPVRAVAETQTVVPPSAPIVVQSLPHPQVARKLAWQYGRIALENETLSDAAEEFARYSDTRIIVDPAIAGCTITGLFASNDPIGFARVAASVLELRVEEGPKEVRIVR